MILQSRQHRQEARISMKRKPIRDNLLTEKLICLPEELRVHSTNVGIIAEILAKEAEIELPRLLYWAGLYHHLGESMGILEDIKQIPLRSEQILREHIDALALTVGGESEAEAVIDIVRHQYERIGGSGYPNRLQGDKVSLPVRLLGIADVTDNLLCGRFGRAKYSTAGFDRLIRQFGEPLFGADVIRYFEQCRNDIYCLYPGCYDRNRHNLYEDW